ncbi:MAG: YegS/Rv2252/BmrU family lipid kinase [Ferruginibacter sp.]
MNRNFIYFINPISGTKNKDELLQLIDQKTRKQNIPYQVLHTNASGDYFFLLEKINTEKITDIIICGGDGSINQVAAALIHVDINIGVIPMGSGNGLALAAGISRKAGKALDIIFKGKASYIDGFYINSSFSCMLCGLGFDAQVAHDFAKHPSRGLSTYIKLSIKNFLSAKAYPFVIEANNTRIKTNAFFISIANSNQFGNNFTIAPRASLCDGLLDIVVVNKMSKIKLVYSLLKQIRLGQVQQTSGKKFRETDIQYFQTDKLVIKNPSAAPLHIDGDPAITTELFKISIVEKAFRLLQP